MSVVVNVLYVLEWVRKSVSVGLLGAKVGVNKVNPTLDLFSDLCGH